MTLTPLQTTQRLARFGHAILTVDAAKAFCHNFGVRRKNDIPMVISRGNS